MVTIGIYSDVICPWCFIGKRRMEKGLAGLAATVRWHPFELNPDLPREGVERRAYRVKKFGSWERSLELDAQVGRAFAGEGIAFNPERMARTPNTFDAHRIIWLGGEQGVQAAALERRLNELLRLPELLPQLVGRSFTIAVDYHAIPYYGGPKKFPRTASRQVRTRHHQVPYLCHHLRRRGRLAAYAGDHLGARK